MKRIIPKICLILTIILFSLNFTQVMAQTMLVQVLGGGYRIVGPDTLPFDPVEASISTVSNSTKSIRSILDNYPEGSVSEGYLQIEDLNGGSIFNVQISAPTDLTNTANATNTITTNNIYVKNVSDPGTGFSGDIETIEGRNDGISLNPSLNVFTGNDLSASRVLATGTGEQPGIWKIFPEFQIEIPAGTPVGSYETQLVFTII